jgi:hypothetical protein
MSTHLVFILMSGVAHNRMLAIHRIRDSAEALFMKIAREKKFEEELKLIQFELDQHGLLLGSKLLYAYTEKGGVQACDDGPVTKIIFN